MALSRLEFFFTHAVVSQIVPTLERVPALYFRLSFLHKVYSNEQTPWNTHPGVSFTWLVEHTLREAELFTYTICKSEVRRKAFTDYYKVALCNGCVPTSPQSCR